MFLDIVVRSQAQRLVRVPINVTELWFPSSLLPTPTGFENPAELWLLCWENLLEFARFLVPTRAFQEGKQEAHPWDASPHRKCPHCKSCSTGDPSSSSVSASSGIIQKGSAPGWQNRCGAWQNTQGKYQKSSGQFSLFSACLCWNQSPGPNK